MSDQVAALATKVEALEHRVWELEHPDDLQVAAKRREQWAERERERREKINVSLRTQGAYKVIHPYGDHPVRRVG